MQGNNIKITASFSSGDLSVGVGISRWGTCALHLSCIFISVCRLIAGTSEAATYIFTASRDHHHHHHHHHLDTKQKKKVIRKSGIAGKNFKRALAVVDQSAGAWSERPSASQVT
jgi:hypothetical protein